MSLYKILELPPPLEKYSSINDIKKNYRKLALIHHPDKNSNTEYSKNNFQKINAAYNILSDEKEREKYDKLNLNEQNNFNLIIEKFIKKMYDSKFCKHFYSSEKELESDLKALNNFEILDSISSKLKNLNINQLLNKFIDKNINKEYSNNLYYDSPNTDSETHCLNISQCKMFNDIPDIYKNNKNNINLNLKITIKNIINDELKKINVKRKINNYDDNNCIFDTFKFIFPLKSKFIIFPEYGDGDNNNSYNNGHLIIQLLLPETYIWNNYNIFYLIKVNLYEFIYGTEYYFNKDKYEISPFNETNKLENNNNLCKELFNDSLYNFKIFAKIIIDYNNNEQNLNLLFNNFC